LVNVVNDKYVDSEVSANFLSVSSSMYSLIDSWVLNSTYSYHMCLNTQWFEAFKSYNVGIVLMGNKVRLKAIGIGTIKFEMFDKVVRTLTMLDIF
jgi:hypothetical protein